MLMRVGVTITALVAPAAGVAQTARPTEGVAAIVNDQVISFSDVRERAGLVLLGFGARIGNDTIAQVSPRVIQALIDEKLKVLEAEKFEINISNQDINAHLEALAARNNLSSGELISDLQQRRINPQTLRERIRADIAWRRVVTGLYGPRVRVSDTQVDRALERWNRISQQEQFRIAEIFLPAENDADKASALRVAWQLYDQIVGGARFDMLAQRYSAAITAATGGELGWLSRADLPSDLADSIVALPDAGLSEPIIVDAGVYLVALIDRQVSFSPEEIPLHLKQAIGWSTQDRSALEALAVSRIDCDDLETGQNGAISIVDLGDVTPATLSDPFKQAVLQTQAGSWTPVLPYGDQGLAVILICNKRVSVPGIPDRPAIENQIYERQLNLLASRHLRNLRRSATIIRPDRVLR